jgi:hypothetical protein
MSKGVIVVISAIVIVLCCIVTITILGVVGYLSTKNESRDTISEVPYEVNTFLNRSDMEELEVQGFTIHKGFSPPNIEGEYYIEGWNVKFDKMGIVSAGYPIANYSYIFKNQTEDGRIDVEFEGSKESGIGTGGYVSGKEGCFTLFIDQTGESTNSNCAFSMPVVLSGCLDENSNIESFNYANLMKSVTETEECKELYMPVGNMRIIRPDDGFVTRVR